jgi:hypothetical protein
MTYELAKELKDAGFKFDWDKKCPLCQEEGAHGACPDTHPTLSELIEAIEDFRELRHSRFQDTGTVGVRHEWLATAGLMYGRAPTPEEAVARLWLELNKK